MFGLFSAALVLASGWSHNGRPGGALGGIKDTSAPVTTILTGPTGPTTSTGATFTFSASEPATFMCTVDLGSASCTSPATFTGLSPGDHTFTVTATDTGGNVELSPPSRSWIINGALTTNYSLEFAGDQSGYVGLSVPSGMNVTPSTGTYSGHLWFKPGSLSSQQALVSRAKSSTADQALFMAVNTDGSVYGYIGGVSSGTGGNVSDLGWHDLAFTVGGGVGKVYLDGSQIGSNITISTQVSSGIDYLLGCSRYADNTDCGFPYTGRLQNFTWWNSTLTAAQVAELHHGGTPLDPLTHSQHSHLTHWWKAGDGLQVPTVADSVGTNNGSMLNTSGLRLVELSPTHTPSSLSELDETGADLHFVADNWDGSGNWTADLGSWTGVKTGSPVKSSSSFSGRSQASCAGWFRVANNAAHRVTTSSQVTYIVRMYTGSLNGTGGFYLGYDATVVGKSGFQIYNFFYDKDGSGRLRKTDDSGDYLAAESHNSQHANNYVDVGITIDMTVPRIRYYTNGGLIYDSTTTSGSYAVHTDAPLGICGIAYTDAGGYNSTAAGQKIMEVIRYTSYFTQAQMALASAQFNALKGYIRNVGP